MATDSRVNVHIFKAERGIEALSKQPEDKFFVTAGAIAPPFDPEKLASVYEDSNSLPQVVASYATNIDGFGYVLEPIVDFDSEAGRDAVRGDLKREGKELSDEEFEAYIAHLEEEAEEERVRLKNFLDYISIGISFTTLRKRMRVDLEVTGNAYWEVLRDEDGNIAKIVNVASHMMRLMPLDQEAIEVTEHQRVGALGWEKAGVVRRFRRYVQKLESGLDAGTAVYFKEFGDPRVVSSQTGNVYETEDEMHKEESTASQQARPASEIIHHTIFSPTSPYGVPRWVGNLPSVLGSRSMEEVNLDYFDNKGVPPMAVLVSGGILTNETIKRMEQTLQKEIKGKSNFHALWVLEATSSDGSNVSPKIELKPLMSAVLSDAVFQKYDERNIDKIGSAFRVPRLLRGDVRDFNKSTSWASIRFAEEQVFAGEREEEDFVFNRTIFADMQVKYWRYRSQGPTIRDPETIVDMLTLLAKVAALAPNEVRAIAAKALNIDLAKIEEDWARRPAAFTLAGRGFPAGEEPVSEQEAEDMLAKLEKLNREVAQVVAKIQGGVEDNEVRAFRAMLERQLHEDVEAEADVSTASQGTDTDDTGRESTGGSETLG